MAIYGERPSRMDNSGPRVKKRVDVNAEAIDHKNPDVLKKYVTEHGKILPRRFTNLPAKLHRRLTKSIKRARSLMLMK